MCIPCDELLTVELVLLFCSDLIEGLKKKHFTARSLRMLFKDISLDCISLCLKINILGNIYVEV